MTSSDTGFLQPSPSCRAGEGVQKRLTLSVVDQSPVRKGGTTADALRETIELAERTEALGYRRYWVAEHHNLPGFAGTAPEILVGQIAARTRTLRVGSGGVMLSHYSALKVAETFLVLEALYPGRIDLGLGRAPGSDPRTATALVYPGGRRDVSLYPEQVDDLLTYLEGGFADGHHFAGIRSSATPVATPEVWLLGSGLDSALLAAERGLPFSFAHFFGTSADYAPTIAEHYRTHFRPSATHPEPRLNVSVQVVCADREDEARALAASLAMARLNLATGRPGPIVSPEEALGHPYSAEERAFVDSYARVTVIGDPDTVSRRLGEIAEECGTTDLGVVTICFDFEARVRSYELVAKACALAPPAR